MTTRFRSLRFIPSLCSCGAPFLLLHCGEVASGPASCEDIGDEATRSATNQEVPVFKVIAPNGGETFQWGTPSPCAWPPMPRGFPP